MKSLHNFLNERLNNNTAIRENDTFYHVSKEDNLKLKDYPMFVFADKKESDALVNNFKEEGYDSNQYVLTLKPNTLLIDGDEASERIDDWYDSVEPTLLSNPDKKELEKYIKLIENAFKDKKVDGVYLNDYSQINYADDAESVLIFHPNKSVKSFKLY